MITTVAQQLIGAAELQQVLGVSRRRAWELAQRADFPTPVAKLIMGSVWDLNDVQQWADDTGRTLHPLAAKD
jgi:predicted DNA-binding transcriptional regulator AlpA